MVKNKELQEINRRVYGNKNLAELKRIGKKQGLRNVDQYKTTDKNTLIDRLVKGRQLKDEDKGVLFLHARDVKDLKVNENMSKKVILEKITNPKLTDFKNKKLRELADEKGIPLRSQMTDKAIIQRLENPTKYYTVESLKRLARSNNIDVRRNISKPDLINILGERNLITTTPIQAQESNLWVEFKNIPEALRRVAKKKARNAREEVADFKEYIKNINKDYITPVRLKKLSKQLEKKIKKAVEEQKRIFTPIEGASSFKNSTTQYVIKGVSNYDPISFLKDARPTIVNIMNSNRNIKAKLYLNCIMKKTDPNGFSPEKKFAFHSIGDKLILEETDPHEIYQEMIDEIEEEIQKVEEAEGSGWVFVKIIDLTLHTSIWDPLNAGSYIDLPKALKNKKAIINMKNEDDKCFLWSVLRGLNLKDKNNERIDEDLKNKEDTLNMEGINYPVDFRGVDRFESQNPDIAISILGYNKDEKIYPLKISKDIERKHQITLLLIKDGENSHYCLVKNLSALLISQLNNKHKSSRSFCLNCFNGFNTIDALIKHTEYCNHNDCVKINMPPEGSYLYFKDFAKSEKAPFTIYADFESIIKPLQSCKPNPNQSYTNKYQLHKPISFCYYIKSFNESVYKSKKESYIQEKEEGPDAMLTFIKRLEEDVRKIAELGNKKIEITDEEEKEFNKASDCWICGEYLGKDRVRDHCHYTGRYRGPAHNNCNLKYRKQNNISVFFHNLAGYDSHLFIKKLGFTEGDIDCIPNNEEKYISFTKTIKAGKYTNKRGEEKDKYFKIIFKDSLKFLAASLDVLVSNTPKDNFTNSFKKLYVRTNRIIKTKRILSI